MKYAINHVSEIGIVERIVVGGRSTPFFPVHQKCVYSVICLPA